MSKECIYKYGITIEFFFLRTSNNCKYSWWLEKFNQNKWKQTNLKQTNSMQIFLELDSST